jgi:F-type H+-transporting ATPase subunit delta
VSQKRLARAYAEALFSAAQKRGQEEELGNNLEFLKKRFEEDAKLQKIIRNQRISPQEKEKALKELIPRLLSRKKEEFFTALAPEYRRLLDQAKNLELVEITVAAPLSPSLESELVKRLSDIMGKTVRLEVKIDPKILGGLIINWGDRVVDASLKKKLELVGAHLRA